MPAVREGTFRRQGESGECCRIGSEIVSNQIESSQWSAYIIVSKNKLFSDLPHVSIALKDEFAVLLNHGSEDGPLYAAD